MENMQNNEFHRLISTLLGGYDLPYRIFKAGSFAKSKILQKLEYFFIDFMTFYFSKINHVKSL
jgi:hypothetical protein